MSTALKRGLFIVVEGLDRSGKSTQALALQKALQLANIQSELIRFPDRTTPTGKVIDGYLTKKYDMDVRAIHLLFSANRWESASKIEQMLSSGISVISDRYAFSGVVYTAAKGIPLSWCKQSDIGLPAPDLTLFLEISPEVAALRGGYGEERYEETGFQKRVREVFAVLAKEAWKGKHQNHHQLQQQQHAEGKKGDDQKEKGGERGERDNTELGNKGSDPEEASGTRVEGMNWVTIDAGQKPEEVQNEIRKEVDSLLSKRTPKSLQRLWVSHTDPSQHF